MIAWSAVEAEVSSLRELFRRVRTRLGPAVPGVVVFGPTLLGLILDVALRGRTILGLSLRGKIGYLASSFVGVGFWFALVYLLARIALVAWSEDGRRRSPFAIALFVAPLVIVFPFVVFAYGVQAYYLSVFDSYITRDTLRLGIALRGNILVWLGAWGLKLWPAIAFAIVFTVGLGWSVRRTSRGIVRTRAYVPALAFVVSVVVFWRDTLISTEWLQSPDASLQNALVGLLREAIERRPRQGLTYRDAVSVPELPRREHQPNVLLVITESVRADMLCSEKSDTCISRFLDDAIPERVGLRRMTAQSSGTVTSCMTLWTGLAPNVDLSTGHTTPFIWEIAKSVGYRTLYVASQYLPAFGLGPYLANAGIDVLHSAEDLGGVEEIHIGAPDERATAKMVEVLRGERAPWLAVLHLSNTHYPYRVDRALQPFTPHDDSPFSKDLAAVRNHIKNSVLLQERTLATFFRELRALPSFDDTVVLFVSDHGDQLREHGALFHLNSVFEEEVRVPAWVVYGSRALSREEAHALGLHRERRVFHEDVNASILDLLGAFESRASLPHGDRLNGESLFRSPGPRRVVAMSTASGVWFDDKPIYGVMSGEWKVLASDVHDWVCYNLEVDEREMNRLAGAECPADLVAAAALRFPNVPHRE
jgi:hypothetical protein